MSSMDERVDTHEDPRTDLELVEAANQGDTSAFEAIYYRYRNWVYSAAYRYCGNEHDACDVLQETYIYLLNKFPGFQLTCKMTTFLYPVVRNLSFTQKKKLRSSIPLDDVVHEPEAAPVRDSTKERESLASMVHMLPEAQREVVLLRFADGLDLEEIAQALDIPLGTVKSRLHNALKVLKGHLSPEE